MAVVRSCMKCLVKSLKRAQPPKFVYTSSEESNFTTRLILLEGRDYVKPYALYSLGYSYDTMAIQIVA